MSDDEKQPLVLQPFCNGLLEAMDSSSVHPLPGRCPKTVRGWLAIIRGVILVDVLRRCSMEGCYRRRRAHTFLGTIPVCREHFAEWYAE